MRITPPADDYGLQRLKQDDSKRQVKAAEKVAAIPAIEADETATQAEIEERRQQQRRKRERRRLKARSPLDSRSQEERRQEERRTEGGDDDAPADDSLGQRIDDFA